MFLKRILKFSIIMIIFLGGYEYSFAAFKISRPSTLNSGLVGHWTFDGKDVVSGVAVDRSGNGNDLNLVNIATSTFYSVGKIGQGFNFDGVNDIASTTSTSLSPTSALSVSAWIYSRGTASDIKILIGGPRSGSPYYEYAFVRRGTNNLALGLSTTVGGQSETSSIGTIPTNVWTHVAATWDGSNIRLYMNGVMDSGSPIAKSGTIVEQNNSFQLGNYNGIQFWDGLMDDVRVYNRALSGGEVKNLYNQGLSKFNKTPTNILNSGLVGHWTFDGKDVVSGVAVDRSGNGNNGNLQNIATSTFYSIGKIGQGFNFDGSNDWVDLGDPASLQITGAITLAAWVKFDTLNTIDDLIAREAGSSDRGYRLNKEANGIVGCNVATDATTTFAINAATVPSAGVWYHFVCVFTPSTSIAIFINGVQNAVNTTSPPASQRNATVGPDIGTINNSTTQGVDGTMDDVRIYNRALSAGEVKMLYNMGR